MSTEAKLDLKSTVNLPNTKFPQKGNLPQNEPIRLQKWEAMKLYERLQEVRADAPLYVLHDGPPYANGRIHMGHVLNKVLKDFCVKSRSMMGFRAPYIPGWDCHGLPIEIKVEEALGSKKHEMHTLEIRRAARKHAEKFIALQATDFKRLGIFGEWDRPYLTMNYKYQADIVRTFGKFVEKGSVYKGSRPVHWCISCMTSLAEAEIEYKDHTSHSVYVKFPFPDAAKVDPQLEGKNVSIVIWTTTPWTLPANLGISLNPEFEYSAVEVGGDVFIVASGLLEQVAAKVGWPSEGDNAYRVIGTYSGEKFDRLKARHPFIERDSLLMLGDHVTLDAGTGAVHTAPGHGYEDFVISRQYGIEPYNPVDSRGFFMKDVEHFAGLRVVPINKADANRDGNLAVIAHLTQIGALLKEETFQHQYPHCWRCHNPVVFRATPQWFISMTATKLNERAIAACDSIEWVPEWGRDRMKSMFKDRGDWCISRQRAWGVPITVFYCDDCGDTLCDPKVINHIADIFEQESADAWYEREASELLPVGAACKCGSHNLRKEMDILDVWFDSGSSSIAVLKRNDPKYTAEREYDLKYPASVYLEGGDQFRGWFNSSLVVGLEAAGGPPYESVITYGWVVDVSGDKMSKSKGTGVELAAVLKTSGVEILRLWASALNYHEDMRVSDEILKRVSDAYRKLRNTARYCLGNLDGFDPTQDQVPFEQMLQIDQWALCSLNEVIRNVRVAYDRYEFQTVFHMIYSYSTITLSSIYLDILKDRLYTLPTKSLGRRSAQTAIYNILHRLTRLIAPILAFTADEIWENIPGATSEAESVHLALFPNAIKIQDESQEYRKLLERYGRLFNIRDRVMEVLDAAGDSEMKVLDVAGDSEDEIEGNPEIRAEVTKALEEARSGKLIGASLEAKIIISAPAGLRRFLESFGEDLRFFFIVSKVEVKDGAELKVEVVRAEGEKCERCWHYTTDVGSDARYPGACARCAANLDEMLV